MQRITITIDDPLLDTLDRLCVQRGYASRSEAVRDLVRDTLAANRTDEHGSSPGFGVLSYVFSHGKRDLAGKLTSEGHHHGVSVASMHVHLSEADCLEVAVLKGSATAMQTYADAVTTQRGVRYGRLQIIPDGEGSGET